MCQSVYSKLKSSETSTGNQLLTFQRSWLPPSRWKYQAALECCNIYADLQCHIPQDLFSNRTVKTSFTKISTELYWLCIALLLMAAGWMLHDFNTNAITHPNTHKSNAATSSMVLDRIRNFCAVTCQTLSQWCGTTSQNSGDLKLQKLAKHISCWPSNPATKKCLSMHMWDLSYSQLCHWRLQSSRMWHCAICWADSKVSKHYSASISRSCTPVTLNMNHNHLKHQRLLTQQHSITSQKTWVFQCTNYWKQLRSLKYGGTNYITTFIKIAIKVQCQFPSAPSN